MNLFPLIEKTIKKIRFRMSVSVVLRFFIIGGTDGFLAAFLLNAIALFIPIPFAVEAGLLLGLTGMAGGFLASFFFRPSLSKAALLGDSKGLKESLITALERKEQDDSFTLLQREQTIRLLQQFDLKKNIPYQIPWKRAGLLLTAFLMFLICTLIPANAKDIAVKQKEINALVKEEEALIEQVKQEILKDNSITELQTEKLNELLDLAIEELQRIEEPEELAKVMERLDTKLEKEKENQDSQDFSKSVEQLSESLSLPSDAKRQEELKEQAEALKKELEKTESLLSEEQLTELAEKLSEMLQAGDVSAEDLAALAAEAGIDVEQLAEMMENASLSANQSNGQKGEGQSGQGSESGQGDGQGQSGQGSESGQGSSQGQSGQGSESGQGSGQGQSGQGQGSGQGQSSGGGSNGSSGTGWDYGSKNGFEKAGEAGSTPEELDIPGRILGEDGNLTGTPSGSGSYFTESESGLTWSGTKVEYGQVVGDYTAEAYNKINQTSVPDSVKDIVKDYFSSLNE